jgi:hypothetical protein
LVLALQGSQVDTQSELIVFGHESRHDLEVEGISKTVVSVATPLLPLVTKYR